MRCQLFENYWKLQRFCEWLDTHASPKSLSPSCLPLAVIALWNNHKELFSSTLFLIFHYRFDVIIKREDFPATFVKVPFERTVEGFPIDGLRHTCLFAFSASQVIYSCMTIIKMNKKNNCCCCPFKVTSCVPCCVQSKWRTTNFSGECRWSHIV